MGHYDDCYEYEYEYERVRKEKFDLMVKRKKVLQDLRYNHGFGPNKGTDLESQIGLWLTLATEGLELLTQGKEE